MDKRRPGSQSLVPRVSVIIPTLQSVRFVQETIESVLAQTYEDYEIIVVDGGSTDGTREVLNSYGNLIKVLDQKNKGISNARNIGVLVSRGEYIAFVDSDDVWLPDKLKAQTKFLESKPDIVGLIYSDALYFSNEKDSKLAVRCFQMQNAHRGRIIEYLLRRNFIPASTVMVRKSCFEKIGLFDESLSVSEDLDMWIRIAEYFEIDYQDMILAKIRSHPSSVTHDLERHFQSLIKLQDKVMPYYLKIFKSKSYYSRYYKPYLDFGISYLLTGKTKDARQKFSQYIKLYPYNISAYPLLLLTLLPFDFVIVTYLFRCIPRGLRRLFRENLNSK